MAKRTDIHRPSAIVPADYIFIACDYYGGGLEAMEFRAERERFRAHMKGTGGHYAHITRLDGENGSCGCDVCGAHCSYVAHFYHKPTNTYLTTGMDCAAKMEIDNAAAFKSFRKRVQAGLQVAAGRNKAQKILADLELSAAWAVYTAPVPTDRSDRTLYEERTINDIVGKLVRYGSISDGQASFVNGLLNKIADRPRVQAEREAKDAHRQPIPVTDKRITIKGTIISAKVVEGDYGTSIKVTIEHADGWKVWGSLPSELADYDNVDGLKGQRIELDARVIVSDNDPKFGFFKRPTKASLGLCA